MLHATPHTPRTSDTAEHASPRGKFSPARMARIAHCTSVLRECMARALVCELPTDDAELEPLRHRYSRVDHPRVRSFELEQYNFFRCLSAAGVEACWSDRVIYGGARAYIGFSANAYDMQEFAQVYGRVLEFMEQESQLSLPQERPSEILDRWREECLDACTQNALGLVATLCNHPEFVQTGVPTPIALRSSFPLVWARMQMNANYSNANANTINPLHAEKSPIPSSLTPLAHDAAVVAAGKYSLLVVPHVASFEREQTTFFATLSPLGQERLAALDQESTRNGVRADLGFCTKSPGMLNFTDVQKGAQRIIDKRKSEGAGVVSLEIIIDEWSAECIAEFRSVALLVEDKLHGDSANFITGVLPRSLYDSFPMVWGSECVNGISP